MEHESRHRCELPILISATGVNPGTDRWPDVAHKGPIRSRPSSSPKWRHERRAGASREVAAARIRPITSNETSHRWNRRGRSRLPLRYAPERGPLDSEGHKEQKKVEVQGNYRFETTRLASTFLDLCVSSLRRGHANLLCIVLRGYGGNERNGRRGKRGVRGACISTLGRTQF